MELVNHLETGKLEIYYLKRAWSYLNFKKQGGGNEASWNVEWQYVNALFNTLGIGLEPTIKYIFSNNPSFAEFEDWILKNGKISPPIIKYFNTLVSGSIDQLEHGTTDVLSDKDLKHFDEEGYVIIKNAISKEDCQKTVELIYQFIEATPDDPATWYKQLPTKQGIMVQLFNHELLDKNRLSDKIKRAYQQLWKRNDLLVSMDRVSFNPPVTKGHPFPGPNLHWDVSLKRPVYFGLQGLLYLSDTEAGQGAFTLVPGFHKKIEDWLENLPEGAAPRKQDLKKLGTRPLSGQAGDFIIWHHALPHGSCPNTTQVPRIVQYINYQPIQLEAHDEWV